MKARHFVSFYAVFCWIKPFSALESNVSLPPRVLDKDGLCPVSRIWAGAGRPFLAHGLGSWKGHGAQLLHQTEGKGRTEDWPPCGSFTMKSEMTERRSLGSGTWFAVMARQPLLAVSMCCVLSWASDVATQLTQGFPLKPGPPLPGEEGFVFWFTAAFSGPRRTAGSEQAVFALNAEDAGRLDSVLEEGFLK